MDCTTIEVELLAYHLATLDDEARRNVDAHLLECKACLRAYLALKYASDRSRAAVAHERPSPAVRARLRADVARTFAAEARGPNTLNRDTRNPHTRDARPSGLTRPIPLYQCLVGVALAAAITLVVPEVVRRLAIADEARGRTADVGDAVPEVDTSRQGPRSLTIY